MSDRSKKPPRPADSDVEASASAPFEIGGEKVRPGTRHRIDLPVARLPTHTHIELPLVVLHGHQPGPRMFLSAAIHGDEVNGIDIIRRVIQTLDPKKLTGTVVAAPIVNLFGFIQGTRYLPDRRDLNRSFPGSKRGSLASRLAYLFAHEIVNRCTHGIDFHTAGGDRTNVPQIRVDPGDATARACAEAFAPPVLVQSSIRPGSLRRYAKDKSISYLLYEAGEPFRFNPRSIEMGVAGTLRVMAHLGMWPGPTEPGPAPFWVKNTTWIRARRGGLLRLYVDPGACVSKGDLLGVIADSFGDEALTIECPLDAVVIGSLNNPVVHQGDAILHLAPTDRCESTLPDERRP